MPTPPDPRADQPAAPGEPMTGGHRAELRRELVGHARRLRRPTSIRELPARSLVTLAAVGLATLVAVAASAGTAAPVVVMCVVALAGAVLAVGWTRLVGLPSRQGTFITVSLSAVAVLAAVVVPQDGATLRWVPAALAVCVVAAFLHQLVRRDGRPRVVTSLSGTLVAIALLAAGSTWVAIPSLAYGHQAIVTAWAALVVAAFTEWACHRARLWSLVVPAAVVAGVVAGVLVGVAQGLSVWQVLALALAVVAPSLALRALLAPLPALVARRSQLISGAASVLVAGPLAEVVTRHLLG